MQNIGRIDRFHNALEENFAKRMKTTKLSSLSVIVNSSTLETYGEIAVYF